MNAIIKAIKKVIGEGATSAGEKGIELELGLAPEVASFLIAQDTGLDWNDPEHKKIALFIKNSSYAYGKLNDATRKLRENSYT